jgi:cell division protein FtsQ
LSKKKKHSKKKQRRNKGISAIWVILSLALVGGAVYAGIYLEKNTVIQEVRFTGNEFTGEQELEDSIELPIGMLADSVKLPELISGLRTLPYVQDVSVNMSMRGTLTFRVYEREPIAMLVDGSDRIYVGKGGIKLPVTPQNVRDVPLLYGFPAAPATDTLNSDAFRQIEQFLTEAKSNEIGWFTISEVAWNNTEGVVALTSENGVKLLFGRDDFDRKLLNWEAFYTEIVVQKGIHSFSSIDLRFRDQIVTQNI